MCMMQAPHNRDIPSLKRREKEEKKHIAFDKEARMKPDPNFVDERKIKQEKPKKSFFETLIHLL